MNRDKLSILLSIIAITIPLLTVVYVVLEMSKPQTGVPRNNGLEAPQFFLLFIVITSGIISLIYSIKRYKANKQKLLDQHNKDRENRNR
ncbi:hypothetical protein [Paenibacillus sp. IITD108]|uniref:hypothetical protein n=1 Tax=Paenibacillus sp. IITD108 TaxID=3116649 RepID=UPI002F3FD662